MKNFNKQSAQTNNRGYLLLEALLATVILAVSITFIIQSMVASLRVMTDSARYTVALNLLESKMIELIRGDIVFSDLSEEENFPEPHEQYRYSLMTNLPQEGNDQKINEVYLEVSWNSGKRKNNIGLTTYLFDVSE